MVRAEFLRFTQSLKDKKISGDEWRMAHAILNNLDELIPLGTSYGHRGRKLAELVRPIFEHLPTSSPNEQDVESIAKTQTVRLHSLQVGPFRGFTQKQTFDLDSSYVFLYGPNGTGKSCFCEALELALLGTVQDCSEKRMEGERYFRNARTGKFSYPELLLRSVEGWTARSFVPVG